MPLLAKVFPVSNADSSFVFFSVLFIPEYGRRMTFYAFRSSTWPSGGRPILGHVGSFMALHLVGSGQFVRGAGRRCTGFIPGILRGHLF